jgi:hypothetical protein
MTVDSQRQVEKYEPEEDRSSANQVPLEALLDAQCERPGRLELLKAWCQ